jgi:hypothetical protein
MTRSNDKDAACDNGTAIIGFRGVSVMEAGIDARRDPAPISPKVSNGVLGWKDGVLRSCRLTKPRTTIRRA